MERLSKIAQGIFLGNGEVWNFLDYAINRKCSDLLAYTKSNNYLKLNLFNGLKGPVRRRVYDVDKGGITYILRNGVVRESTPEHNFIGDVYSTSDDEKNIKLRFVTKEEFRELNNHILKTYEKERHEAFIDKSGDDNIGTKNSYNDVISVSYLKTFFEKNGEEWKWNDVIGKTSFSSVYSIENDKSEKKYTLKSIANQASIFYFNLKNEAGSRGLLYPSNFSKTNWNATDSYGIGTSTADVYTIDERAGQGRELKTTILTEFTSGEHKKGGAYTYYQEADGNNNKVTSINKSETVEGNSVQLSSYGNGSRLLQKTNELFLGAKVNSLINRFHTSKVEKSEFVDLYYEDLGLSRGRNLVTKDYDYNKVSDKSTGYDNPYCRVWTAHRQYSRLKHRMRPFIDGDGYESIANTQKEYGELRPYNGAERLNAYSVLREDGFVRVTPTYNSEGYTGLQNYMFSIENLAWKDINTEGNTTLSKEQRGPFGGRIMWFPPYNLRFSENVNVNWNANSFIGRGEEMYTYTNTVRTGTLDFTLLVDHPSILNKWRGTSDINDGEEKEKRERDILRFFAGCNNLEEVKNKEYEEDATPIIPNNTPIAERRNKVFPYIIFFPNAFSGKDYIKRGDLEGAMEIIEGYNKGGSTTVKDFSRYKNQDEETSIGFIPSDYEENIKATIIPPEYREESIFYYNDLKNIENEFADSGMFSSLGEKFKVTKVELQGFASSHGERKDNEVLYLKRTTFIKKMLCNQSPHFDENNIVFTELPGHEIKVYSPDDGKNFKDSDRSVINLTEAKIARCAIALITVEYDELVKPTIEIGANSSAVTQGDRIVSGNTEEDGEINEVVRTRVEYASGYTYDNEYLYFSELKQDSLVYKSIMDKVRFFDPAYHSMTPEGFNARLTFLHQCTRQGPTNSVNSGRVKGDVRDKDGKIVTSGSNKYLQFAGNLSFGRAPFCILRIGDFFHTKICIDSVSIQYDNDGIRWDMNQEGIGVQPMYANVSISFKFLGGQDISRPIERLQNAVTANYYANTSVYNRHSDNENYYFDAFEANKGSYNDEN